MALDERHILQLRHEILADLRAILIERLRVSLPPEHLDPDTILFGSGLGLDSVDAVDLAIEIERRLEIRLGDSIESRQCMRSLATLTEELVQRTLQAETGEATGAPAPPPLRFADDDPSALARECEALRRRVGLATAPDVRRVRLRGAAAFDLLDRVSTRDLFIRSGQVLHTLFLDDAGRAWADVYVAADDEDFVLFAEGPSRAEFLDCLRAAITPGEDVELLDLEDSMALLDLSGPFSWELMERLVGPEVLGIPYLNFFDLHELGGLAFRLGKTGEYAYQLLLPRAGADAAIQRLCELGQPFDLAKVSDAAIDLCGIEAGFFCAREPRLRERTPAELQLWWRVSLDRAVPGIDALRARAAQPDLGRVAWFRSPSGRAPAPGQGVFAASARVGEVLVSHHSAALGAQVGVALLERPWTEPKLNLDDEGGAPLLTTVIAPLVRSLSLSVDPQRHTFASRAEDGLLGLV